MHGASLNTHRVLGHVLVGPLLGAPLCRALVGCNLQKQVLYEAAALGLASHSLQRMPWRQGVSSVFILFCFLSLLP